MDSYTIEDFWLARLGRGTEVPVRREVPVAGWSFPQEGLPTFCEARLKLSTHMGDAPNPDTCPILLVSAPGAVGKTTLAREIACVTGSIYIDLAEAGAVGAHTLTGGLADSSLYDAWRGGTVTALIDGLDEARLRVTEEAFRDFLSDVARRSVRRNTPTVLFGRTGAIEEAWLVLDEHHGDVSTAVLEIGYYGQDKSVAFANGIMQVKTPPVSHIGVRRKAVDLLLRALRRTTETDGDRFAGYAPVLQAVADRVVEESNPQDLVSRLERGDQPMTLQKIVGEIMDREQGKLTNLGFADHTVASELYLADEQLDRLAARIYGSPPPPIPEKMLPSDAGKYDNALKTGVGTHPFLIAEDKPRSEVFSAAIAARALRHGPPAARSGALRKELDRGAAANPFLSVFYLSSADEVDPEHIGIIYASVRAGLALGDTANLFVRPTEESGEESELFAEAEISVTRRDANEPREWHLETDQAAPILLGSNIEDVDVVVPHARVEVGTGREAVFVAPVKIECKKLVVKATNMVVEPPPGSEENQEQAVVLLEAGSCEANILSDRPVVRGTVTLSVWWPGATNYPWTGFANEPAMLSNDPTIEEALRRFGHFVLATRARKNREPARFRGKLEHSRMTKGSGQAVLDHMIAERILVLQHPWYVLDVERLFELTGTSYRDCMERKLGPKAVAFVKEALGAVE